MTSLVLGLALAIPAHPPGPVVPVAYPYRVPRAPRFIPVVPAYLVQPVPVPVPLPLPEPVPVPLPEPVPQPALTLEQFSRFFTPVPGEHRVLLIHPRTGRPVPVCFTLPEGKLRHFEVSRDDIDFDFGRNEVEIIFRRNGTVDVKYHN